MKAAPVPGHALPQLAVAKGPRVPLGAPQRRKLKVACTPALKGLSRRAGARKQAGDENVRVQNRTHASAPTSPRRLLRFESQSQCLVFAKIVALPKTIEEVEPQLAPKGVLDYLAIASCPARAPYARTARRTSSSIVSVVRTFGITASKHHDAAMHRESRAGTIEGAPKAPS